MTTLTILAALTVWAAGVTFLLALCRSAAAGDRWRDDLSLERAAQQFPGPGARKGLRVRGD